MLFRLVIALRCSTISSIKKIPSRLLVARFYIGPKSYNQPTILILLMINPSRGALSCAVSSFCSRRIHPDDEDCFATSRISNGCKKNSLTVSEGEWYLAKEQPYSMVVLPSLKALRNADNSIQDRSRKYSEQ